MPRQNLPLIILLATAGLLNLIGVFGPETGFDALWYHLTIPKLYLEQGRIEHIPGGLLYYSDLPRLVEMAYLVLFKVLGSWGEVGAHLLNWIAGLGAAIITFRLARKFLSNFYSLLATLIFYVTPLVGWLSGSAYVDLPRSFFEVLALYLLLNKRFLASGLAIGLAMSTKTLAIGSFGVLTIVAYLFIRDWKKVMVMVVTGLSVATPWYLSAYLNTGNPFYPVGSGILDSRHILLPSGLNPVSLLIDFWKLFIYSEDPITPVFVIVLPYFLLNLRKIGRQYLPLVVYAFLAYLVWWITPRTGGGRFILPYLPVFSILTVVTIAAIGKKATGNLLIYTAVAFAVVNLLYRAGSLWRLKPYFLGEVSKEEYLCRTLDSKTRVFVDCTGYMARNIQKSDLVFVRNLHNLYYVNFPFIHESWYRGERYNYIMTEGSGAEGKLIYEDPYLKYQLYKL